MPKKRPESGLIHEQTVEHVEVLLLDAIKRGHGHYFVMTPHRIRLLAAAPVADRERVLALYEQARAL